MSAPKPFVESDETTEFHECVGCGLCFHESELVRDEAFVGWWWCEACNES